MADTKDFLIKLSPELGASFQNYCKSEGRSQQSVFSQLIGNFINGGSNPAGTDIVDGLLAELISQGRDYQQALLDQLAYDRLKQQCKAMEERMARACERSERITYGKQ